MLNEIVCRVEREKAGMVDPTDEQRKRPLAEHLADFQRYLKNKGVTPSKSKRQWPDAEHDCDRNWKLIGDISASGALDFLGNLRDNGRSAQTYNHYLKSVKQFTRWLVRDRRTPIDPLAHLSKLNVSTDRRHDRRALTTEEFASLDRPARNGKAIETFPGPDRAMMYVLAAWTGFRKGEIGSLTHAVVSARRRTRPRLRSRPATASGNGRIPRSCIRRWFACLQEWLATKTGPGARRYPVSQFRVECRAARNGRPTR